MRAERPPLERLLDIGLRMNALRSRAKLHAFLIDAAVKLVGAGRVLLVLDMPAGFTLAGARVRRGEDGQALLQAVTPWLEEVRRTRSATLRHGPEGASARDQRSCLIAPLIAGQDLLGYLYADVDGARGPLRRSRPRPACVARGPGRGGVVPLRFTARLQAELAERAAEALSAREQADLRESEPSLIHGIQRDAAQRLPFEAIVDRAGDKFREVFGTGDIHIVWSDRQGSM